MRRIAIVLSVLAFVGCKTMEQRKTEFAENTDRFIGKNADDLVIAKGPPSNTYTLSTGGKVFEYSKSAMVTRGGGSTTVMKSTYVPNSSGYGSWVQVPTQQANPVYSREQSCKILFQVSPANIIDSWKAEGNACY